MTRSIVVRLLLSLVLLLSQQMASLHALDHLGGVLDAHGAGAQLAARNIAAIDAQADAAAQADALAKAVAQHQNCHQCLAFAHLAAPLAGVARSFAAAMPAGHGGVGATVALHHSAPVSVFQARAPPPV